MCVLLVWNWNIQREITVGGLKLELSKYSKQGVQRTITPLTSEPIAHSLANRLETVRVSHWPITWLIYLHALWPKVNPIVHPCQLAIPFLKYDFFSNFDLENPRSRSWKRWTLKAITWVQHSVDSHPFRSMSIGHPIHKIKLFQNLTLKIQGQGQRWGESWKSQLWSNILLIHIPLIPCQSAIPFLRYDFFKIWPWKSKVKVMGEVDIESHNMGPTFYRLTSL